MTTTTAFPPSSLVIEASVPEQRSEGGRVFPLVLVPSAPDLNAKALENWAHQQRDRLLELAELHGAVLFRGFPLRTDKDFDGFVRAFDLPNFKYEESLSNAVRTVRTERVFTANEAPSEAVILLHHELAQTPQYPSHLFFFCELPAQEGGATPLCRSDLLFEKLAQELPDFVRELTEKGVRYSHTMPSSNDATSGMGRGWQSTLRAQSREEAEERLRELGYTFDWLPDGCLRVTTPVLPAIRRLSQGRTSFFNQLIAAYHGWKLDTRNGKGGAVAPVTFGDGSPLNAAVMQRVVELAESLTFECRWETRDVALVDNFVSMHGRRPFKGPRKVLASLIAHRPSPTNTNIVSNN